MNDDPSLMELAKRITLNADLLKVVTKIRNHLQNEVKLEMSQDGIDQLTDTGEGMLNNAISRFNEGIFWLNETILEVSKKDARLRVCYDTKISQFVGGADVTAVPPETSEHSGEVREDLHLTEGGQSSETRPGNPASRP